MESRWNLLALHSSLSLSSVRTCLEATAAECCGACTGLSRSSGSFCLASLLSDWSNSESRSSSCLCSLDILLVVKKIGGDKIYGYIRKCTMYKMAVQLLERPLALYTAPAANGGQRRVV